MKPIWIGMALALLVVPLAGCHFHHHHGYYRDSYYRDGYRDRYGYPYPRDDYRRGSYRYHWDRD